MIKHAMQNSGGLFRDAFGASRQVPKKPYQTESINPAGSDQLPIITVKYDEFGNSKENQRSYYYKIEPYSAHAGWCLIHSCTPDLCCNAIAADSKQHPGCMESMNQQRFELHQ